MHPVQARWCTPPGAAAIGVLRLCGSPEALAQTIGQPLPEIESISLRNLLGHDEGLIARPDTNTLLLTPHGGPRVRQVLTMALQERGVHFAATEHAEPLWNAVTKDAVSRRVLSILPIAASDAAIPLLLAQPKRWKHYGPPTKADGERSRRLRRLIVAPVVAIVGPPNAGKSSLLNALAGREVAAASPEAGTTRDFVGAMVTLDGLSCMIIDAPGVRATTDAIEHQSISAARKEIARADLCISLAGPDQSFLSEWPDALHVRSKCDLDPVHHTGNALHVSAVTGQGLPQLARTIRQTLVPDSECASDRPFDFEALPSEG